MSTGSSCLSFSCSVMSQTQTPKKYFFWGPYGLSWYIKRVFFLIVRSVPMLELSLANKSWFSFPVIHSFMPMSGVIAMLHVPVHLPHIGNRLFYPSSFWQWSFDHGHRWGGWPLPTWKTSFQFIWEVFIIVQECWVLGNCILHDEAQLRGVYFYPRWKAFSNFPTQFERFAECHRSWRLEAQHRNQGYRDKRRLNPSLGHTHCGWDSTEVCLKWW
jgi:hypothetical protein